METTSSYCSWDGTHGIFFSFGQMAWVVMYEVVDEDGDISPTESRWMIPVEIVP